jgi:hypothetical protein
VNRPQRLNATKTAAPGRGRRRFRARRIPPMGYSYLDASRIANKLCESNSRLQLACVKPLRALHIDHTSKFDHNFRFNYNYDKAPLPNERTKTRGPCAGAISSDRRLAKVWAFWLLLSPGNLGYPELLIAKEIGETRLVGKIERQYVED